MMAGTNIHDRYESNWFDPLGPLFSNKYHMYAHGNMYALSSRAAAMITNVPLAERRLSGGSDDTSVGCGSWDVNFYILMTNVLGCSTSETCVLTTL